MKVVPGIIEMGLDERDVTPSGKRGKRGLLTVHSKLGLKSFDSCWKRVWTIANPADPADVDGTSSRPVPEQQPAAVGRS